jgi:hypothetical protein
MSVIPVVGAVKSGGFWQKLAHALDQYSVDRIKRAVPEITLRRSKHEVGRYRRLMLKSSMVPADARISRVASRRVAQPWPR